MDRMHRRERICSVFTNDVYFPKLDVAGSIPVSRSIFLLTYRESFVTRLTANAVIAVTFLHNALIPNKTID